MVICVPDQMPSSTYVNLDTHQLADTARPKPLMELLVLLAALLLGLSVLICRSNRRAPAPPAPAALHKISDPAVAHRMLVDDADVFSNRPVMPFFVELAKRHGGQRNDNISTVPHGPHWRALRRNITAETLHPSRLGLGQLAPLQREAIQDLVAVLQSAGAGANLRDHLRAAVSRVIARLCFGDGVDECHMRAICSQLHGFQVAIGEINPSPGPSMLAKLAEWRYQRQLLAIHARLTQLCIPLIVERRRRPHDQDHDLSRPYVDTLIRLRVPIPMAMGGKHGGRRALRDDEIVDLALEFLGSGTGSLVVCLEWTLAHLVLQPEVQNKLRREVTASPDWSQLIRGMPYLHAVILESLRMHPPAPVAMRHIQADAAAAAAATLVEGGTTSDVTVLFILGDIGRDRKAWKDPDEFRPERFLAGGDAEGVGPLPGRKETRMIPFGAGHRFCPGVGLAMGTIKCFLAALVREFEWAPATDAAVDLTELDGFLKTMKKPLSARLTRLHIPSSF